MVLVSDKPMNFIVLTGRIVMVMHFLHTGRKRHTLPGTEEPMITLDFITALFYEIDEQLGAIPKHPEAHLWPSAVRWSPWGCCMPSKGWATGPSIAG